MTKLTDRDQFLFSTQEAAISYAEGAGFRVENWGHDVMTFRDDMPGVWWELWRMPRKRGGWYWERKGKSQMEGVKL